MTGRWFCACGHSVPSDLDYCSACWADRKTGDRQWARLTILDLRPAGEVPELAELAEVES